MEPFIGTIIRFAGNFAPRGWMFCDGQILSVTEHTALYLSFVILTEEMTESHLTYLPSEKKTNKIQQ